jgi:hypothetical protein
MTISPTSPLNDNLESASQKNTKGESWDAAERCNCLACCTDESRGISMQSFKQRTLLDYVAQTRIILVETHGKVKRSLNGLLHLQYS